MLHSDALQTASLGLPGNSFRPEGPDTINVQAILRFLRKRRRLCLAWLFGGLLLGIGYGVVSSPSYTATAAVLLQDPNPRNAGEVAMAQSDAAHSTYVETQVQVFTSNEVIGRVVDTLNLVDDPEFGGNAGGLRTWLIRQARLILRPSSPPRYEPRYATIVRVRSALAVHRVGTSDVLEIQFKSRIPARAADFADAVIRGYIDSRLAEQASARAAAAAHDWKLLAELREKAFPTVPPGEATAETVAPGPEGRAHFLEEQQKVQTYRGLYERLLQRAVGNTDAQLPAPGLQVITPATPPLIAGSRLIVVIACTCVGAILGLGHALAREMADDVVRTADDLCRFDGIPRVTVIPKLSPSDLQVERPSRSNAQLSYALDSPVVYDAMGKMAVAMLEASSRRSRRVIGVVSSQDGAGASLVAGQLARILADTGSRICLLDANWRLPSSGARLPGGVPCGRLTGWTERIAWTAATVDLLTLRATTPVSDLTASLSIVSALEGIGADHQWVVVDFHALARTVDLEAVINLLDQVVVIVEANRTTREGLRAMLNIVPRSKRASVVLNKATVRRDTSRARPPSVQDLATVTAGTGGDKFSRMTV